jgi:hypothetical protein
MIRLRARVFVCRFGKQREMGEREEKERGKTARGCIAEGI